MNNNEKIVLGSFISVFLLISILVIYNRNAKSINPQSVTNTTETLINTNIIDEKEISSSVNDEHEENSEDDEEEGFEDDKEDKNIQQVPPTITTSIKPQVITTTTNVVTKKLSISPRCIGCGKCARVDSIHFQMAGELSTVTSQNNLDSQNLQMAINICPVSAISIN